MTYEEFEKVVNTHGQKIGIMNMGTFAAVHGMLTEGENVIGAGSCIDSKGPGALIVTEQNFYAYKKTGILAADSTVIPLEKISSYSASGFGAQKLEVSEGTLVHVYTTVSNTDSILSAIKAGKAAPPQVGEKAPPTEDKFEEIKKYKELLDQGIISQADFDKKKAELLKL
jgi:hypothetical protein